MNEDVFRQFLVENETETAMIEMLLEAKSASRIQFEAKKFNNCDLSSEEAEKLADVLRREFVETYSQLLIGGIVWSEKLQSYISLKD
jgi:hypothetical protein